ncbi:phytoene/squalene synthase family protein [Bradyrhizobium sp. SYSU BS000235]|uniref:phytoene/squalene synthase family protein n=1 Tax=Bradyrhizobium sp. SYSU BS000235 TaxID=3411332 RepID=UPI003C716992
MTTSASGDAAFCADLVRTRDFTSYAASLFVPPAPRRAWLALAAFRSEVAHVRDHVSQALTGEIRLQWWRDALTGHTGGTAHGDVTGNPVAAELLRAIKEYGLPVETFVRLIDAHVFDVYDDPMPDIAALEAHCRDTSAALYTLRARTLGVTSPEVVRIADHAGVAEGLVDVMLALPRHSARRQLYLPADLMNLHDVIAEDVFMQKSDEPLREALAHLRREARKQLDTAMALMGNAPAAARPAFLPVVIVQRLLSKLDSSNPFDPPSMSRLATLWTIWRAASGSLFKS